LIRLKNKGDEKMNEIIALQKYENEAQLAKELIRGF